MSRTLLTHRNCGGSVILDLSDGIKLMSPSFELCQEGVSRVLLDVKLDGNTHMHPKWICAGCGQTIDDDHIDTEIMVCCQVCTNVKSASDVYVHSSVTSICSDCFDDIKRFKLTGKCSNPSSREYSLFFSIGPRSKMIPLPTVLKMPVPVGQ